MIDVIVVEAKKRKNDYNKKYYRQNLERLKKCERQYYYKHKEDCLKRVKIYYQRNKEYILERNKRYRDECKEQIRKNTQVYRKRVRIGALIIVGNGIVRCFNCGCDNLGLIEINHLNGGGTKELFQKSHKFYLDIVKGRRVIDDLNLLCRVCNHAYYVKLKYGADYKIKYLGGGGKKIQEGTVGSVLKATL